MGWGPHQPDKRKIDWRDNSLVSLIMKFCQEEDSSESEEQQHRVQKNETGNAQPSDILEDHVSFFVPFEAERADLTTP